MFYAKLHNRENFVNNAYHTAQLAGSKCVNNDIKSTHDKSFDINVEKVLMNPGHHTAYGQHADHYLTFDIENIPVSLATFGLHYMHPFYNSSQRSGRYSANIFKNDIVQYAIDFCNQFNYGRTDVDEITDWISKGISYYICNIDECITLAKEAILYERCNYKGDVDKLAEKLAQEQLRCFISTITPTGLYHTLNISSFLALHRTAWNAPLQLLTELMGNELKDTFVENHLIRKNLNYHCPDFYANINDYNPEVVYEPNVMLCNTNNRTIEELFNLNDIYDDTNIDTLMFDPNFNNDDESYVFENYVFVPVSIYAQDQRHRMIQRRNPIITGDFMIPPLVAKLKDVSSFALEFINEYNDLVNNIGPDRMLFFIPYGAMVSYKRSCDIRPYLHLLKKRLCHNAELTICKVEQMVLNAMYEQVGNEHYIGPTCFNHSCLEGKRTCGRSSKMQQRIFI